MLEMSLSGNPALIALPPAGKNICSSAHLLTRDFIYLFFNLQTFVPTTLQKQFQNCPQAWLAQQHPHLYAAAVPSKKALCNPAPNCSPLWRAAMQIKSHIPFCTFCFFGCLCLQSRLGMPVIFGCHCSPC